MWALGDAILMGGEGDRTTSNNWILRFFMGTVAAASLKRLPRRGTSNCKPDKETIIRSPILKETHIK
jgi:hypothetical protein